MSALVSARWAETLTVAVSGGGYTPGEPNGVELPKGVDLSGVVAQAAAAALNDGVLLELEIKASSGDDPNGFAPLINGNSGNITTAVNTQFPGVATSGLVSLAAGCRVRLNGSNVGGAPPADQTFTVELCANYQA